MSIADTKKKIIKFYSPPPPGIYLEGRIKKPPYSPTPLLLPNQHFRAAAAYIERSLATNASVYCYFGGISPLLNWYFSQRG